MKINLYKSALLFSILVIQHFCANAQMGVEVTYAGNDVNYSGKIITERYNADYLSPNWNKGAVMLGNDSIYRNLNLMYDVFNDRPIFKSDSGIPQMFKLGVKEFSLNLITEDGKSNIKKFKNGFPSIDGGTRSTFYELLSEGKVTLLKRAQIKIIEERPTGSIYNVKQKKLFYTYFILSQNNMIVLKRDKKQILSLLNQTNFDLLNEYINTNKLNLKNDNDLLKFLDYYNGL